MARQHDEDEDGDSLPKKRAKMTPLAIVALIAGLTLFPVMAALIVRQLIQDAKTTAAALVPPPSESVDLATILAEWKTNPVAVFERYRNRSIMLSGTVKAVSGDGSSGVYLDIAPNNGGGRYARVRFRPALLSSLKDYPVGTSITVEVTIDAPDMRLRATATRIVESGATP